MSYSNMMKILEKEMLRKRAGNISYAVVEPYRRFGYATEMIRRYWISLGNNSI